jgi:hypothetical protein
MTPIVAKKVKNDEVITYSAYLAAGNTQTCTAQGFIYILTLRAWSSYYAALMILCELPSPTSSLSYVIKSNLMHQWSRVRNEKIGSSSIMDGKRTD